MSDWPDDTEANPDLGNDDSRDRVTESGPGLAETRAGVAPWRMTILLVEDDASTNDAVAQLLRGA